MLFARYENSHLNISEVEEILRHRMKGSKQINVKYANKLYHRPANEYESDSSMTKKVQDTNLMLFLFPY